MRKSMLLSAATAALVLVSCSQDETVSMNMGDGIAFRTAIETRGSEVTTGTLNTKGGKFNVTAYDEKANFFFKDQEFKYDNNSFTSTPLYYWPATGTLSFFAYYPTDIQGSLNTSNTGVTLNDFAPESEIKNQADLILATATGNKASNEKGGVALEFKHQLSQIEVKAKNTNTAYTFKIKGVKIAKVLNKGTLKYTYASKGAGTIGNWETTGASKTTYTVSLQNPVTLESTAKSLMKADDGNAMLIPQQLTAWKTTTEKENASGNSYLSVLVQITTKDGAQIYPAKEGGYGWAAVGIGTNWEKGKKYIYTLDFSNGAGNVDPEGPGDEGKPDQGEDPFNPGDEIFGDPIKFTVTVKAWEESEQGVTL